MKKRVAILISGRGSNLERILCEVETGVLAGACEVVSVISNRADAGGLAIAARHDVPTRVVPSAGRSTLAYGRDLLAALEPLSVDYVVLAGFLRILSPDVVARYRDRVVNIHPPTRRPIRERMATSGRSSRRLEATTITVHLVDEGLDTGRVLAQRVVDLDGATTFDDVVRRGLEVEHALYSETLARLFAGRLGREPASD